MPLCSSEATTELSLTTDLEKPEAIRPVFILKFLPLNQVTRQHSLRAKARLCPGTDDGETRCLGFLREAIELAVVGWRNFDKPFSIDNVLDSLSDLEIWELADSIPTALVRGEIEQRKRVAEAKVVNNEAA